LPHDFEDEDLFPSLPSSFSPSAPPVPLVVNGAEVSGISSSAVGSITQEITQSIVLPHGTGIISQIVNRTYQIFYPDSANNSRTLPNPENLTLPDPAVHTRTLPDPENNSGHVIWLPPEIARYFNPQTPNSRRFEDVTDDMEIDDTPTQTSTPTTPTHTSTPLPSRSSSPSRLNENNTNNNTNNNNSDQDLELEWDHGSINNTVIQNNSALPQQFTPSFRFNFVQMFRKQKPTSTSSFPSSPNLSGLSTPVPANVSCPVNISFSYPDPAPVLVNVPTQTSPTSTQNTPKKSKSKARKERKRSQAELHSQVDLSNVVPDANVVASHNLRTRKKKAQDSNFVYPK
jgi:hypothetical protein